MAETMLDLIKAFKADGGFDPATSKRLGEALQVTGPVLVGASIWSFTPEEGGSIRSSSELATGEFAAFVDDDGFYAEDMSRIPPEEVLSTHYGVPLAARMTAPPPGAPPARPLGRSLFLRPVHVEGKSIITGAGAWLVDESNPAQGDWRRLLLTLDQPHPIPHARIGKLVFRATSMGVSITFGPGDGPPDGERTDGAVSVSVERMPRG